MSQAKVDKYKEYKKNRKKNIAKEKRRERLAGVGAFAILLIVFLAVILSIGKSLRNQVDKSKESLPNYNYVAASYIIRDYADIMATVAEPTE